MLFYGQLSGSVQGHLQLQFSVSVFDTAFAITQQTHDVETTSCLCWVQSSVFVTHFSNAFWHESEVFPKGSSQNEIILLFVIFHLPYNKHRGVKICSHSCRYQNQNFSLASHLCRTCASLVSYSCCSCLTRVALVSLWCRPCHTHVVPVWDSCCKVDQITKFSQLYKKV